jgi:hypothetical protein
LTRARLKRSQHFAMSSIRSRGGVDATANRPGSDLTFRSIFDGPLVLRSRIANGSRTPGTTRAEAEVSARTLTSRPVGRAAQAAVCRTAKAGATPARDSLSTGISVERYTPVFQTEIRGAIPRCPIRLRQSATARQAIFRDANTGAGQNFTGLAAAVQLRLRVALGLQTLTVKSRLLTGENTVQVRGDPPISKAKV